jgi:hypothetical protein
MKKKSCYQSVPPKSSALVESMRDIGYSMESAVADIVDNSIAAAASEINIRFMWNSGNPWLAVIDNGYGMDEKELISAMRFGSISPIEKRSQEDLGRFGLGLKTATFSQCRCLTVLSKKANSINVAQWDLEEISKRQGLDWPLLLFSDEDIEKNTELARLNDEYLNIIGSGTIVLWQHLDRIEEGTSVKNQESRFNESIRSVREHLELVFHRFLSPDAGKAKIKIFFNKKELEAFDPFNLSKSTELRQEKFLYEGSYIIVQPYILPHHNKVSKSDWKKFAGKQGYLQSQGFYVYRNKRLIIDSTWFRLIAKEELTKLLRVKVDIPNSLDHLWKIDVKKSNAFPPAGVRDNLRRIIGKIEISGKNVYQQRGQRLRSHVISPAWVRVAKDGQVYYEVNKDHPLIKQCVKTLSSEQQKLFFNVLSMLNASFPRDSYYSDLATNPEQVTASALEREKLEELLNIFVARNSVPSKERLKEILLTDPFVASQEIVKVLFKERGYEF